MSDRKKFKKWMKRQGAWGMYKARYNKDPSNKVGSIKSFLNNMAPERYIGAAFMWEISNVPDIRIYWKRKHDQWVSYLESIK